MRRTERRWPPFYHRSTSGSLCPSSVGCQRCSAQFALQYCQRSHQVDWTRSTPACHQRGNGIQDRGLLWSCREEPSRQRTAVAPTLSPGAHRTEGRGVPSACSGWWQTGSYVVCAPSEDYVTGCLLTRWGSKMLGMHQAIMVHCVNWMFGYCVLIGCLATKGSPPRNSVIKESCWFGERDWVGSEGSCRV